MRSPYAARTLTHMNPNHYAVCDTCATAIVNHDYSSFDADVPRITAWQESHPAAVHIGSYHFAGYWECEVCQQVCIGSGHILETEN